MAEEWPIHTCHAATLPWPWEVAFRTVYSWHGRATAWKGHDMCESNMAAWCKSNGKDTFWTLSGTAWYVWIRVEVVSLMEQGGTTGCTSKCVSRTVSFGQGYSRTCIMPVYVLCFCIIRLTQLKEIHYAVQGYMFRHFLTKAWWWLLKSKHVALHRIMYYFSLVV
jgi:hypothetical protein